MRATPESPRMFDSDLIDFFSRTHPAAVPALFVPAVAALLVQGWSVNPSLVNIGSLALGGFIAWTLIEYWLHRLFFHWVPKSSWGERMHFMVHGVHHQWPRDKYRLVMPPAVSISLFVLFLAAFWALLGIHAWPFHAGFTLGYMVYDLTHYALHHHTPRSRFGKALKKHHMVHHFADHTIHFGVSSMLWDYVFGTHKKRPRRVQAQSA